MWLPNALNYGVPYELFFKLNPTRLEPFRKAKELGIEERQRYIDILAWSVGTYTMEALAAWWGKRGHEYPEIPRALKDTHKPEGGMTDGDRFAAFAAAHRRAVMERRKSKG